MILGVHHPALAVPDIQKALDFYCGVLGFKEVMTAEQRKGGQQASPGAIHRRARG